jgi:triacylglycerol lipase
MNAMMWERLLGAQPGSQGVSPYAAPARAENLAGLPPAFIVTGALDLFVEENLEYARRLMRAGVPCEFHVYPGAVHGFDSAPGAAVSIAARRAVREALRRALYPA